MGGSSVKKTTGIVKDIGRIGLGVTTLGTSESYLQGKEAKKAAEAAANKQEALAAKQQKLIDDEQRKQQIAADERKTRLASNELLSGSETGIMNKKASLLR